MSKLQIQSNSFVVKIISFIIITQFFLLLVLIAFTTNTYRVLQENQKTSVRSTLQIYMKQIESKFSAMDKCLNGIMAESSLLWQLGDGNEANRYFASMEIQKNMKVYMLNNQEMDYLVAVGNEYHNLVASAGSRLSYHQKKRLTIFYGNIWEKN